MGQYLEGPGTGDLLGNGQDNCNSSCYKTQNIQHIANLAICLFSCAPNLFIYFLHSIWPQEF